MKILELFGGIGACSKALERLGIKYELSDYVEIDKFAVKSFNAIHNTNFVPQDIREWNKDLDVDLIMHGSPCQDFSISGKGLGGDKDSGTRSSLMYETLRIVAKLKPKYVIWENVKNLLSEKHRHNFEEYLIEMNYIGYNNYYKVLNAKDYGIPQNRERVFTISIRKDINKKFIFPETEELKLRLKDFLEDNVDKKYYLKDNISISNIENSGTTPKVVGGFGKIGSTGQFHQQNRIYDNNIAISVTTSFNPYYVEKRIIYEKPILRKGWHRKACEVLNTNGITTCLHTQSNNLLQKIKEDDSLKIRKLTPRECWRLMGFDDEDFNKAQEVNSNTQLYKQAGNSIVVNVLEKILINLLKEKDHGGRRNRRY